MTTEQQIPVLTYHAGNITGNSYQSNDRIAFQSDLYTLHQLGFKIIPLHWLVDWLLGDKDLPSTGESYVALSCDDGIDHDYLDGEYLQFGPQKSLYNLLRDFQQEIGIAQQPHAHLTAFVIADYQSRQIIADKSLKGQSLFNDHWWPEANNSALMSIENHSWDHRHPYIYPSEQALFSNIDTLAEADKQIIQAKKIIDYLSGGNSQLFCYPWGQTNSYLVQNFLPKHAQQTGIKAAFTCEAKAVTKTTNRWQIPRFVCGPDWHSPAQLKQLLSQFI
jgi:Polysaccharide deacetylase.